MNASTHWIRSGLRSVLKLGLGLSLGSELVIAFRRCGVKTEEIRLPQREIYI